MSLAAQIGVRKPAWTHGKYDFKCWIEVFEGYQSYCVLRGSRGQASRNRGIVLSFLEAQAIDSPYHITSGSVLDYLCDLGRSRAPHTVNNHRAAISSFCRYLVGHGLLEDNPVDKIPNAKRPELPPSYLREEDIPRLVKEADRLGCVVEIKLCLMTGLRMSEMARLQWDDIGEKTLLVRKSKSGRPRTIPLPKEARVVLREHRRAVSWSKWVFPGGRGHGGPHRIVDRKRGPARWMAAIRPLAAIFPQFREVGERRCGSGWHLLRHTYATRLAMKGVPARKIQQWMGHQSISTTQRYMHCPEGYDPDIERISL